MGQILLPEQSTAFQTNEGFKLSIDTCQNAIRGITHPTLNWKDHESSILKQVRKEYPGIQIWKMWTVTYSSSPGAEESIEVAGCKADLPEMFPGFIRAEEA